jgi:hypothetical protein
LEEEVKRKSGEVEKLELVVGRVNGELRDIKGVVADYRHQIERNVLDMQEYQSKYEEYYRKYEEY